MTYFTMSNPKSVDPERTIIKLLINSPTIARFIRLLESNSGVDKLIRTVQFISRFIAFYYTKKSSTTPQPQVKGLAAIRKHFGLSRKLIRFGNTLASLYALGLAITDKSHSDPVDRWTAVAQHAGFAAFSTVDSATYLHDVGICKVPRIKTLEKLSFIFWLWALASSILGGLYRLQRIRDKLRSLTKAKSESSEDDGAIKEAKVLRGQSKDVALQILGASADALFPASALSFPVFRELNDGMLGLAGSVSSFTGLRGAWNATKV